MRKSFSRAGIIGGAALAVMVAMAIPAGATITAPTPAGGTFTGPVSLADDGTTSPGCNLNFGATTKNGTTHMFVDQGAGTAAGAVQPAGTADTGTATVADLGTVSGSGATNAESGSWTSDNYGNGTYTVNSTEVATKTTSFLGLGACSAGATTNAKETITIKNTGAITYVGATTASQNTTIPVSAHVTDENNVNVGNGQTVTFTLTGATPVTATTTSGVASTNLPVGLARTGATLTVSYAGTYFTAASTAALPFTVTTDPTTTTLSPTTTTDYGNTDTLTATVTSNLTGLPTTPGGTVQFTSDGNNVGSPVNINGAGVASVQTSTLNAGSHTIKAVYSGDVNYTGSTAATVTQVVNPAPTQTTISSSVTPSVFGQAIVYTATVRATDPGPSTGFPTGTVSFSTTPNLGSPQLIGVAATLNPVGVGSPNSSTAQSISVSQLPVNTYVAAVAYAPCSPTPCAANFAVSNSTTPQTINQAGTTVAVGSTQPFESDFGQSVQFTATVSTVAPGHGPPTGTVDFVATQADGPPIDLGTVTLGGAGDSSSATTPPVSNLSPEIHIITATYTNTDGNFVSGTSNTFDQVVAPDPSTTTITTVNNANPSLFGQPVQFQATVTLAFTDAGTPTGFVAFYIDGSDPPNCALAPTPTFTEGLVGGVATTPPDSALSVGTHTISACYASTSSDFGASPTKDPQYVQTVNSDPTTTVLTSANSPDNSSGPSVWGQPVTFTASVTANGPGSGTPLGTVTFQDGAIVLGVETLSGGATSDTATLTTNALSVGNHAIEAIYNPLNVDYLTSQTAINQTVNQATSATAVTQNGDSVQGQAVSFTANVTAVAPGAGTPTGTVEFEINGADIFGGPVALAPAAGGGSSATSPSVSGLTPGSYQVTAIYSGDVDFLPSDQTIGQIVDQASTATTLTATPPGPAIVSGTPVSLKATIAPTGQGTGLPTGSVDFYDGSVLLGAEAVSTVGGVQQATLPAVVYGIGNHAFSAVYLGEYDYIGSTSNTVTQTVGVISTTTTLASSQNPSFYSVPVTFTATVTPSSNAGPGPGGTVTFSDGSTVLGTVPVSAVGTHFQASITESALAVGSHSVTASYSGGADYGSSATTSPVVQTVTKDATSVSAAPFTTDKSMTATLTSAQGAPIAGQTISFTTGSSNTALCTAVTGTNGQATCSATGLNQLTLVLNGSYTATYGGNASYLGSSGKGT